MRITSVKLREIGLLLAFKALLEAVYVLFVNPVYAYSGFALKPNGIKFLESYLFLIFLYFFLPHGEQKISAVGTKLLFILMVVPTLSLYALKGESRTFLYLFVAGFWLTLLTIQILPRIRIRRPVGLTSTLLLGIGMLSIGVYVILVKTNGLPTLKALNLWKVYEIRSVVTWGPPLMGYLVVWQASVINPFLLSIAWYKRRYVALLGIIGLQVFLYLITAHKGFLFAPVLAGFVIYAVHKRNLLRLSLWGLIGVVSTSFAAYALAWSTMPGSLFIRRVLFVPAHISFCYYDFFSKHQLMYLAESHLNPFLSNPYSMPTVHLIGKIYFNSPAMAANTGYLGNAYMNFGALGVFLFSLIIGVIFLFLDSIASRRNTIVAMAAMIIPVESLVNGALSVVLGTHGLLLGMLIVWLYSQRANRSVTLTARSDLFPLHRKA